MDKTIIIADDHPFTVEGMKTNIEAAGGLRVAAVAPNGIEAISLIKLHTPDCAILDLSMPGANGLEVYLEAKSWSPDTRFVIVTGASAASLFTQLLDAGIHGLFVKTEHPKDIVKGILKVLAGERVISDHAKAAIDIESQKDELSDRERQVLHALARGLSNKDIADSLGVSPNTINIHRTNLLRKMNVNSTAALLVSAMRLGMIDV